MSTTISILGGVGLFLLGMTVMTDGLKALAGSALRTVLSKAAGRPLRGAFWGAVVTLLVQSSSATTMTTIGLVSAGLLTFPQGLGLVFGANVGTTATGWLVALIGVRVSLTAAALPMIFVGALIKLLGRGRVSGAGAAFAGFALVLFGLTTLQQGMGGLAERLHPADLPAVLAGPGAGWWAGLFGVLALVGVGLVMTAVMQSSTAAIAVTLSAHYAGAVGLDQGCALIIGQNIGTLRQAQAFMSDVNGPPESEDEQRRLTSTLHALEHASRLAETAGEGVEFGTLNRGPDDVRAAQLCAEAMQSAASLAGEIAAPSAARDRTTLIESRRERPESADAAFDVTATSTEEALVRLERCAKTLDELQRAHRRVTLGAVANGALTADEAIVRVDTVRRLDALAHHAWRSAAQLVARGA